MKTVNFGSQIYTDEDSVSIIDLEGAPGKTLNLIGTLNGLTPVSEQSYASVIVVPANLLSTPGPTYGQYDRIVCSLFTLVLSSNFTLDTATGILTYTGSETRFFDINLDTSSTRTTLTGNSAFAIFKNGLVVADTSDQESVYTPGANLRSTSVGSITSLSTGDTISGAVAPITLKGEGMIIQRFNLRVSLL